MSADLDEAARQQALDELAILDTPPEERFDRVTRLATRLFGVPMAMVTLIDRDRQWVKSNAGTDLVETARGDAFCNVAIQQPGAFVVEDARQDDRFRGNPYVLGDPHIRFYAGQPLVVTGGHRVGALCILDDEPRVLSDAEERLLADLALWVQAELVLDEELEKAAEVQRSLLPSRRPDVDGYEIDGVCIPSWTVGGDFFDWYSVGDELVVSLADVMGKGMGGAIIMATVRAVLRGVRSVPGPADAVAMASAALEDDLSDTSTFVTLFHGRLDPVHHRFRYVDAGHGLALCVRADGSTERLRAYGVPIGVGAGAWTDAVVELALGDAIVAFSDGLLDLSGEASSAADLEQVIAWVGATMASAPSVDDALRTLTAEVTGQADDVTVLALRRVH
jgi:hypothetical protein